jgi:hypothetical protein
MHDTAADISPGASLPEVLHLLQEDPARAAASPAEFRDLMQARQATALSELQGVHFDVPDPIRRVDVKLAPPGGALGAFYVGPSEDFTRPGTVWFAIGDQQVIPLFDQISTAYHEGFPGHHLQNGIQLASAARLSRLQKLLVWYPGSGEGWALYAEDLMEELGYLEKPDYLMGKLASEMLRACRVVIDIGSHLRLPIPGGQPFHPGEEWTFDTGVEMLTDYAAQSPDVARSEMTRYLGWPGQAISYKVGQQAIRDLRAEAQRRHGPGFDRKAFHARLLEVGSVGLDVLRRHLAAYQELLPGAPGRPPLGGSGRRYRAVAHSVLEVELEEGERFPPAGGALEAGANVGFTPRVALLADAHHGALPSPLQGDGHPGGALAGFPVEAEALPGNGVDHRAFERQVDPGRTEALPHEAVGAPRTGVEGGAVGEPRVPARAGGEGPIDLPGGPGHIGGVLDGGHEAGA